MAQIEKLKTGLAQLIFKNMKIKWEKDGGREKKNK